MNAVYTFFASDLVFIINFDPFRSGDLLTALIVVYTLATAFILSVIGEKQLMGWLYIGLVVFWGSLHTFGCGLVLHLQAKNALWTRHFIKVGSGLREAFAHWKVIFNLTLTMSYVSFYICAIHFYTLRHSV